MPNVVVVGAQWGDEGKGKVVDVLARRARLVVRFQGGSNAGHTLVVGDRRLVVHLVPSGVLRPGCRCLVGNGVVVDPGQLVAELDMLREHGVEVGPGRLGISVGAHVVLPWHRRLDRLREVARGSAAIGTTCRGIGPAYEDKVSRRGLRVGGFVDRRRLEAHLAERLPGCNREIEALGGEPYRLEELRDELLPLAERLRPYVAGVAGELHRAVAAGDPILFEGAQGTFLDVDHGTYPYVTSSNTVAGAAAAGSGLGPGALHRVVGVAKAYTTRVGAGPFPTELDGALAERLRSVGGEYGATTGRPRRCGWFDAVQVGFAARLNGMTELALTKLDVLTGVDPIRVAVAYEGQPGYPEDVGLAGELRPVYRELAGWREELAGCRSWEELPAACRAYLEAIEALVGVPVGLVSVGPGRGQTLLRPGFAEGPAGSWGEARALGPAA